MKWKFLNVPLGVNAPSGTLAKCADVAAAANIAGNFLNFIGQMDANNINQKQSERWRETTIEQNKLNRDWQSAENRAAEAWEEYMWNQQNAYNTPSAQRKRLQEAGYNPWISGSGGPQSLAGSAGSGHSNGAAQLSLGSPIPVQNPFGGLNGIAQALGIDAQISNQNAKTLNELIDGFNKASQTFGYDRAQKMYEPLIRGVSGSDSQTNLIFQNARMALEEKRLKVVYQESVNEWLPRLNQATIDKNDQWITESVARIGKMASDVKVNDEKLDLMITEEAKNIAERNHLNADTKTINAIRDSFANKMDQEAVLMSYQRESAGMDITSKRADFIQESEGRKWQMSDEGKKEGTQNVVTRTNGALNRASAIARGKLIQK